MEMAKFDNDQITKELKKGFWLGVMADGPLMPEVMSVCGIFCFVLIQGLVFSPRAFPPITTIPG